MLVQDPYRHHQFHHLPVSRQETNGASQQLAVVEVEADGLCLD